jgi:hypothetical protein
VLLDISRRVFGQRAIDTLTFFDTYSTKTELELFNISISFVRGLYLDMEIFERPLLGMAPVGVEDLDTNFVLKLYMIGQVDHPVISFHTNRLAF